VHCIDAGAQPAGNPMLIQQTSTASNASMGGARLRQRVLNKYTNIDEKHTNIDENHPGMSSTAFIA